MNEVATNASLQVAHRILEAVTERGVAHVVLTGGGDGVRVTEALAAMQEMPWQFVHLWWGDERFVTTGDPDRNDGQVSGALAQMQDATIHRMPAFGATDPAQQYATELLEHLGDAPFDVVMLGMGPDGHVASLFPGRFDPEDHAAVREVLDSPKPPPHRITMTMQRLNNARHVFLLASGSAKREAVAAAERHDRTLPVGHVQGIETTTLVVDQYARP